MVDQVGTMERDCQTEEALRVERVGDVFELSGLALRCLTWRGEVAEERLAVANETLDRIIKDVLKPLAPAVAKRRAIERIWESVKIPLAFIGGVAVTLAAGYAWAKMDETAGADGAVGVEHLLPEPVSGAGP